MIRFLSAWLLLLYSGLSPLWASLNFTTVDTPAQWQAVLQQAQAEAQPIYVFVTTDWCGYCKKMKRDVFALARVSDYYNETFLSVELDGETAFGEAFAARYGVPGFPTHLFFSPQEALLHQREGYQDETQLLLAGRTAVHQQTALLRLKAGYQADTLSDADLLRYLHLVGEQTPARAQQMAREQVAGTDQTQWLRSPYLDLIAGYLSDLSDPRVRYLLAHKSEMNDATEGSFEHFVEALYNANLSQAIATQDSALVERLVQEVLPRYLPDPNDLPEARFTTYKIYHASREAWAAYVALVEAEAKRRQGERDVFWYQETYSVVEEYPETPLLSQSRAWLDRALALVDDFETRSLYAYVEGMLGHFDAARMQANRALALAQDPKQREAAQEILTMIEQAEAGE